MIIRELALGTTTSDIPLEILATDIKPAVLRRADQARYPQSTLRDLPTELRETAFDQDGDEFVLLPRFRRGVTLAQHDIRSGTPDGPFDLALCRSLAFTYFDEAGQRDMTRSLARVLRPGGALVLGNREAPPAGEAGFSPWSQRRRVFRRCVDSHGEHP